MELELYQDYEEFDRIFGEKVEKAKQHAMNLARDFVEIGYLLRRAKDTGILKGSGYRNIYEYAEDKYNIDQGTASRFMNINKRFSEGGYSETLQKQYEDFGRSKLAIMLKLPDVINEELSPEFSKEEIQTIKEEIDAERKITDLEVMIEEPPAWQQDEENLEYKALKQLLHDEPELYLNLCTTKAAEQEKELFSLLAPMGEKLYTIRIVNVGKYSISIKESEETVALINFRSEEKQCYPKQKIAEILRVMLAAPEGEEKEYWSNLYGEEWPIREEKPEQKKPKPSRVTKAKVEQKKPVQKEEPEKEKVAPVQQNPEPVEGEPELTEEESEEAKSSEGQQDSKEEEPEQPEEVLSGEVEEENEPVIICHGLKEEIPSDEVKTASDGGNTEHETDSVKMTEEEYEQQMQAYFAAFEESMSNVRISIKRDAYNLALSEIKNVAMVIQNMQELYLSDWKYEEEE